MKINKKECRKYTDPGHTFDIGSGVLHYKGIDYIAYASIKNIAGQRVLIVYFYNRKRVLEGCFLPEYTLFQFRNTYITFERDNEGKNKWRESSLENLAENCGDITIKCVFHRHKDEHIVTRFCNISKKEGFEALKALQSAILCVRKSERELERDRKIISRMECVPTAPRRLEKWIQRNILPHYIVYEYSRARPMNGYCTACKCDVLVDEAKHCSSGKCPNCGKVITFRASGRTSNVTDRDTVQVLQKISDCELILRIYKVHRSLHNWREPELTIKENARVFIRKHENEVFAEAYYYSYNKTVNTHWIKGERPQFSPYMYYFECDARGYLYDENLDEVLKGTPWQYCQLKRFYQIDRSRLRVYPYLNRYYKIPAIEYLVKLGLTKLVTSIIYEQDGEKAINTSGTNMQDVLGIEKEDLPALQNVNVTKNQFALYKKLKAQGVMAEENLLIWYETHEIASVENVLVPLRHTTQMKLMRYIEEQYEQLKDAKTKYGGRRYNSLSKVLSDYKDYVFMAEKMGYDFEKSIVLFPYNIIEAHDLASKQFDSKKSGIYNQIISDSYQNLSEKYGFSENGLTLIPPKTAKEIITEGHTLNHCVHSYVEKVAKGECLVLFIRQKGEMKKPYYTVEIQGNKIIQIQGMNHCAPTDDIKRFLAHWERKKLQAAA